MFSRMSFLIFHQYQLRKVSLLSRIRLFIDHESRLFLCAILLLDLIDHFLLHFLTVFNNLVPVWHFNEYILTGHNESLHNNFRNPDAEEALVKFVDEEVLEGHIQCPVANKMNIYSFVLQAQRTDDSFLKYFHRLWKCVKDEEMTDWVSSVLNFRDARY